MGQVLGYGHLLHRLGAQGWQLIFTFQQVGGRRSFRSMNTVLSRSNVHVSGRGQQAVVLLHGLGCNQTVWQPLLPAFEPHYRVVRLDLVGTGGSQLGEYSRERHGSLAGHATDLLDVLQALELTKVVFIGHSIGAMIGVLAAVREPARFASLVLLSPSPRFLNGRDYAGGFEHADVEELLASLESDHDEWAQAFAPVAVGDPNRPDLIMALSNSFASTNPGVLRHLARVAFFNDSRLVLPLLNTPALIVQPARDVMVPLGVGYYLNEQLPDSQLVIIDTSGHFPHLTAPEATLAAIGKFLSCPLALPAGTMVSWAMPGGCTPTMSSRPVPLVPSSTHLRAAS
jgi:sigma-B regulation protein RsbQ